MATYPWPRFPLAPVLPAIHTHRGKIIGRQHVRHFEIGIGGVGVKYEWVQSLAQIARILAVRHIAARVAYGAGKQHVRGDVSLRAAQLTQHAAYVRILDAALEQAPRLHHLMTRVVHSGGGVVNGADEREFIGKFRY